MTYEVVLVCGPQWCRFVGDSNCPKQDANEQKRSFMSRVAPFRMGVLKLHDCHYSPVGSRTGR